MIWKMKLISYLDYSSIISFYLKNGRINIEENDNEIFPEVPEKFISLFKLGNAKNWSNFLIVTIIVIPIKLLELILSGPAFT